MLWITFKKCEIGVGQPSNLEWQCLVGRPEFLVRRNASQFTRAAGAVRRKSLVSVRVKLARLRVALDRGIELLRVESLEPGAKPRQLLRGELFNCLLDVFGGGHVQHIALIEEA